MTSQGEKANLFPGRGVQKKHSAPRSHLLELHLTAALHFLSLRSQAAVIFGVFSLF